MLLILLNECKPCSFCLLSCAFALCKFSCHKASSFCHQKHCIQLCITPWFYDSQVGWIRTDTKAILSLADQVITYDTRITVSGDFVSTFNLKVSDVQEGDRGQYMCQINTNPMMSQATFLDVNVPPDINAKQTSGDVDAKMGSTVNMRCNAEGVPKPTIKWRREDGKLIKINDANGRSVNVDHFIGTNLTIHNLGTEDMGSYLCIADNGVPPIVSKRIYLYVQCKIS